MNDFVELFQGRRDAYGTETGGCVHQPPPFSKHLSGETLIGVYPMRYSTLGWRVKWGCVDLDVKAPGKNRYDYDSTAEAFVAATNLCTALALFDIRGWREITRSGGMHVWVFSQEWVDASIMRRALLVACTIAEVPPTEVNPKAESFPDPQTVGNYVRLPYPEGGVSWSRRVILDADGDPMMLETFLSDAMECRTPHEVLVETAKLCPPPPAPIVFGEQPTAEVEVLLLMLNWLALHIATHPPLEGQDRSSRLWKLAHECKKSGLTPSEAVVVVAYADKLFGQKYSERVDGSKWVHATVEKAWACVDKT